MINILKIVVCYREVVRAYSTRSCPLQYTAVTCNSATTLDPHLGAIIVWSLLSPTVLIRSAIENSICYMADLPKVVIACCNQIIHHINALS
jgi:hypothetical protein